MNKNNILTVCIKFIKFLSINIYLISTYNVKSVTVEYIEFHLESFLKIY